MKEDDAKIISDYLSGNDKSLDILIVRYLNKIYNFIYRLCGSKQDSEDVTQDVFLKVWKNLRRYDPNQSFNAWIFKIARNTTIDWLRKKKEFVFSDFENEEGDNTLTGSLSSEEPIPEEVLITSETKKYVEELLEKIPLIYKEVLVLRYTNSLTFEEIGEVLGRPLDTVKSQHRRALIKLKKIVELDMHQN